MPHTVLYKGSFLYDAVNSFVDDMAAGFRGLGHRVTVLDWSVAAMHPANRQALREANPELIVAFGGIVHNLADAAGNPVYHQLDSCYAAVLVDHPLHHLQRLTAPHSKRLTTCCDRSHLDFLRPRLPSGSSAAFLPHGGCRSTGPGTDPTQARDLDILFGGTLTATAMDFHRYFGDCPESIRLLLEHVASTALAQDHAALVPVTLDVLHASGLNDHDCEEIFGRLLLPLLPRLDNYIRTNRRLACLHCLDQAGLAVDIFGNNWPRDLFRRHRVHAPVPFPTMLQLMTRAKLVLNPGANFPDGSHERVFSAMVNGAVALTDRNPYWQQLDAAGANLATFRWTQLPELAATAATLLADDRRRADLAANGQALALREHTWQHRAASLAQLANRL